MKKIIFLMMLTLILSPVMALNYFTPVWSGNGYHHMNIYINSATISGNNLRAGDEIAVFDGEYCVGAIQIQNSNYSYLSIPVSMDDPMTSQIDGYTTGNNISFKLWRSRQYTEYSGNIIRVEYIDGNDYFQHGESTVVNLSVTLPDDNYFTPVWSGNGYNHMNIYVSSAIVGGIPLSYNDEIAVFDGDLCVGVVKLYNEIYSYVSIPVSMNDPVTPETDGYTPGNNISFKIWKAYDYTEYGVDDINITYLQGQNFFEIGGTANVRLRVFSQDETYFTPVWSGNGYQHMNFYVNNVTINDIGLNYGDEIAVFDGNYCVGAVKYDGGGYQYLSIITSMNDPMTNFVDGFTPGNNYSFKIWDAQNFIEYDEQNINIGLLQGTPNFVIGGTVIVNLSIGELISYELSLNVNPVNAGTVSGQGSYIQGQDVVVSTIANAGYQFENWTQDGLIISMEESFVFTMPANEVTLTANYSLIPNYTLSLVVNPENSGTVSGQGSYPANDEVSITATPSEGYQFVNWTRINNSTTQRRSVIRDVVSTVPDFTYTMPAENVTLSANFELIPVFNPPQNLTALPSYNNILLTWAAPENPTDNLLGYKVYRNNTAITNVITESMFTDNDVVQNVEYEYFVVALYQNPDGLSVPSNVVSASLLIPEFNSPQNLTASPGYGYIALNWEAPVHNPDTNLQGYIIYRNNTALTQTISGLSYADNNVENNVNYEYFVVAVYLNPDGLSSPSNIVLTTPLVPAFNPPQNLIVTPGYDQIELSWEAPDANTRTHRQNRGFSFYNVYRNDTVITQTTQLNFIDTNVEINVDYTYYITAVYAGPSGESVPSNIITANLLVFDFNPPQNLIAIPGYGQITLEWEMQYTPNDYTTYKVFRDGEYLAQVAELSFIDYYVENYVNYNYYVIAVYVNPEGESGPSNIITATPLIPVFDPPYNLSAIPGYGQISLEWEMPVLPDDYTTYKVYRNGENIAHVMSLGFIDYNVEDNIEYAYYVTAVYVNPDGESDPSNTVNVSTLLPVFSPPQNLTSVSGYNYITLNWEAPNVFDRRFSSNRELIAYNVYRGGEYISQVTSLTYTDYSVESNVDYTYYVTAVYFDPTGESIPSNEVTATTLIPVFNPPQNLTAVSGYGQISLDWELPVLPIRNISRSRELVSYNVYRNGAYIAQVTELSYIDFDVENNIEYSYYVTAVYVNPDGESAPSNTVVATTLTPVFNPPQNLTAVSGYGQISLEWEMPVLPIRNISRSRELVSYNVYRNGAYIAQVTELSYIDFDVENNVEYSYYVTAVYVNPDGESAPSNTVIATTLIEDFPAPEFLSSILAQEWITLVWDEPVSDYDRALVHYKIYKDNEFLVESILPFFTDFDLEQGVEYTYFVTAVYTEPDGESESSNIITVSLIDFHLSQPVNLTAEIENESIILNWDIPQLDHENFMLLAYRIYRNSETIDVVDAQEPTSYTDTEIELENIYTYRVSALYLYIDETGEMIQMYESPYSNSVEVNYTSVSDTALQVKLSTLVGNYPNPFNPETTISFILSQESDVLLEIFDVRGRKIKTLADKRYSPGTHNLLWKAYDEHGKALSSGVYFYRLKTQNTVETKKMILIK